jgi:hypothetical protein
MRAHVGDEFDAVVTAWSSSAVRQLGNLQVDGWCTCHAAWNWHELTPGIAPG